MSKEHAYAYEAGYRDGSINYELEHCPACKNVADLQEALAENANLRERAVILRQGRWSDGPEDAELMEHAADTIEQLERKNAKLRELAVLNWEWAHSCCGNNCKMQTNDCGYQIDRECNYEREIWDRMRELGVEVG